MSGEALVVVDLAEAAFDFVEPVHDFADDVSVDEAVVAVEEPFPFGAGGVGDLFEGVEVPVADFPGADGVSADFEGVCEGLLVGEAGAFACEFDSAAYGLAVDGRHSQREGTPGGGGCLPNFAVCSHKRGWQLPSLVWQASVRGAIRQHSGG